MEQSALLFEVYDGIATLTLNRPERGNSLNPDLIRLLEAAWRDVETRTDIRAAIVTGAGDRHFCTGAAVENLAVGQGTLSNRPNCEVNRFSPRMARVSKPVICVVNGLANAGGLHFIADSDIVIAVETAEFMDSHVSVGQVSALESIGLVRRCGVGAALLLGLAGRSYRMPANRAFQLGLVDLLEPTNAVALARGRSLAHAMCLNSPQAMRQTKRAIWGATEYTDPQAADFGWELLKSHWSHPDFQEGPDAFAEKRPPRWSHDPDARR